jgi:ubiquinone biosynthesis accessory factor UbiK
MIDAKKIEQFANQVADALPAGVKTMADNVEDKVKTIIQSKLAQLDVVSREEFDVQTQVLARTRAKLEALETELIAIKQQISDSANS